MGERYLRKVEATGSIPVTSTIYRSRVNALGYMARQINFMVT